MNAFYNLFPLTEMATDNRSPAEERWVAEMQEKFDSYFRISLEAKIRLAIDILYDVSNSWDHDTLETYPEGVPSFDEYLGEIAGKLFGIRWSHAEKSKGQET